MRLALLLFLASCVHETDETPMIRVVPGAAARALWYDMPGAPSEINPPPVKNDVAAEESSD